MNNLEKEKKSYASKIIDDILRYTGLNSANFCKKIGVNQSLVYDIKAGKTKQISEKNAEKIIAHYPRISKIWLMTGEGSMLKDEYTQTINGNNSGIIVQHGDNSTYNNNTDIMQIVQSQQRTIDSQQSIIAQQSEQIGELIKIISQMSKNQ